MKALFLDIDGVLTSARAHVANGNPGLIWHNFDPLAISFLNLIAQENPDLRFILSSTWRRLYDYRTMMMFLSMSGFRGEFHQNWKTGDAATRGMEVAVWVNEHKPERYVILDDWKDNGWLPEQLPHLVLTDPQDGMNSLDHFIAVREALKRKV